MSADLLRKLSALGLSIEQVAGVMEVMEAEAEERRGKVRARVQKWRDKQIGNVTKRSVTAPNVSERLTRVEDNLQTKKISGKEEKKDTQPSARVSLDAFRTELSAILDTERIEAIVAVRRKKGATFTPLAARGLVKALRACPNINDAADEMVVRNWTSVKPEWLENRNGRATAPPGQRNVNDVLNEIVNGNASFPGTTIDGSYARTDRGGASGFVQLDAPASRERPG